MWWCWCWWWGSCCLWWRWSMMMVTVVLVVVVFVVRFFGSGCRCCSAVYMSWWNYRSHCCRLVVHICATFFCVRLCRSALGRVRVPIVFQASAILSYWEGWCTDPQKIRRVSEAWSQDGLPIVFSGFTFTPSYRECIADICFLQLPNLCKCCLE